MFPRKQPFGSNNVAAGGTVAPHQAYSSHVNHNYNDRQQQNGGTAYDGITGKDLSNTSNMFLVLGQRKVLLESPPQPQQSVPTMRYVPYAYLSIWVCLLHNISCDLCLLY